MLPAFRSRSSLLAFCVLLLLLLALPIMIYKLGLPSREQSYSALFQDAGNVGGEVQQIFRDPANPDVLFLGASVVHAGVSTTQIQDALEQHLHRKAHVAMLAMYWQGLDLQYFLLRDYLEHHHASLVIWNLPFPSSRTIEPHIEAFRWVRYGESSAAIGNLPLHHRAALYGDMILGAPRQALARLRPNLLASSELDPSNPGIKRGYYGSPFTPDSAPAMHATIYSADSAVVLDVGPKLDAYELNFANQIAKLLKVSGCRIVLLHIPYEAEFGHRTLDERDDWNHRLAIDAPIIGIPSAELFGGMSEERYHHFFYDQHLNANGQTLFTTAITPAILKLYDQSQPARLPQPALK